MEFLEESSEENSGGIPRGNSRKNLHKIPEEIPDGILSGGILEIICAVGKPETTSFFSEKFLLSKSFKKFLLAVFEKE